MQERDKHDLVSVILTGAQATRMRPLSTGNSKAMLPFLGRPLLAYLLNDLARAGLTRALLTDRGKNNDIQDCFGDGTGIGLRLEYLAPGPWRGTAGVAKSLVEGRPEAVSSPFLLIYGDSLLQMDYKAVVDFHRRSGASFTIACHRPRFEEFLFEGAVSDCLRTNFGVVDLRSDGRVTHFEEKPCLHTIETTFVDPVANAAVYVIEPSILHGLPVLGSKGLDFGYHVIPFLIDRGDRVCGTEIEPGFRIDLGTLPHYLSVQLAALRGEVAIQDGSNSISNGLWIQDGATVDPGATLTPPAFVGAGATIEYGAVVVSSIIGERTTVREGAIVRDSAVLDNATIGSQARVESSILGPHTWVNPGTAVPHGTVTGAWSRIGGPELVLSEAALRGLVGGGG